MTGISLVTGANGHLGNNLVRALLARGERVRASVRNLQNREPFEGLDCDVVQADLMDKDSLLQVCEGVQTLYQVAAVVRHWSPDPEAEIISPNVEGTRNVVEAAAVQGVERIVYVSSEITLEGHVSPVDESSWRTDFHRNPYARAKTESERLAWQLAGELDLDMVSVLPGTIVGPHCYRLTPTMRYLKQALDGEVFLDVNLHFNFVGVEAYGAGETPAIQSADPPMSLGAMGSWFLRPAGFRYRSRQLGWAAPDLGVRLKRTWPADLHFCQTRCEESVGTEHRFGTDSGTIETLLVNPTCRGRAQASTRVARVELGCREDVLSIGHKGAFRTGLPSSIRMSPGDTRYTSENDRHTGPFVNHTGG
jgi:NAD(P)-dependent dehydrogenase (short-subunit alcohol dehydrogenase family)